MKISSKKFEQLKKDFDKLTLERVGDWIWVSGDKELFTEQIRDILKLKGFRFSRKKLAWYYFKGIKDAPRRRFKSKFNDLEEVKNVWGSTKVKIRLV